MTKQERQLFKLETPSTADIHLWGPLDTKICNSINHIEKEFIWRELTNPIGNTLNPIADSMVAISNQQ